MFQNVLKNGLECPNQVLERIEKCFKTTKSMLKKCFRVSKKCWKKVEKKKNFKKLKKVEKS